MKLAGLLQSRFLRDSTTLQVGALFIAFGNFLGAVALTHVLGAQKQGQFYLAISVYSFFWFALNLGLYQVATSQVAAAVSRKNLGKVSAWLAYYLKANFALGVLLLLLGWTALPAVTGKLFGDADLGFLAAVLACTPLVELPRVVACAGLQGTRRMLALAQVENGMEFVRIFLVVMGALLTNSATGPIVGMLIASGVGSVLAVEVYRREHRAHPELLPGLGEILPRIREVPLTHGLRLGIKYGLVRNIDAFGVQILPSLILGYFGTRAWVAYLRIAQRLVNVARMFMQGISRTALPTFSEIVGSRDLPRLRRAYWKATLLSGSLVSTGVLVTLPLVPLLIEAVFPRDYQDPVWTIVKILVPGVLVVSFSVANDTFYLVTNTLRVGILFSILGIFVNTAVVAVLTWLDPTVGAAWGLCFTFLWSLVHVAYAGLWLRRNAKA
ncbi:MAG: oligosaccharide flippase family protein [bacterium]|nr:oligosaccharide flippase family protein [bacterium]